MKITNFLIGTLLTSILMTSCSSDDDIATSIPRGNFDSGILISHEGSSVASGSVSFVSNDFETVENGIYNAVNAEQVGTFQQSIGFTDSRAYIVVDNANTITIVDRFTFEKVATISQGLITPRYITFNNNKAYVTNWGLLDDETDDFIAVIDLNSNTVESTIPVGLGPEQLVVTKGKLYVSNKSVFPAGVNNVISVIDLSTNEIVKEIETGYNPDELIVIEDELFVAVDGGAAWESTGETAGGITVINTITDEVSKTLLPESNEIVHVSYMDSEDGVIYYSIGTDIYELTTDATALSTQPIANAPASIYGLSVNEGQIYVTDAKDFASSGALNIYNINLNIWESPIEVGVVPSKIYFNE